jgi:hypothetical protein
MSPAVWQRLESAFVAGLIVVATVHLGFGWWWLFALFLAFDLSAVGYVRGTKVGAATYNVVHNYGPPAVTFVAFVFTDIGWMGLLALAWAFHVAVDRALGYGLKHDDAFQHTHLGWLPAGRRTGSEPPPHE